MATRGRKPLPTAIKLLEGDRGKGRRPINKNEPTPSQENVKCGEKTLEQVTAQMPSIVVSNEQPANKNCLWIQPIN